MSTTRSFAALAEQLIAVDVPVRLVGVDGCGGAGKSTFAQRLSEAGGGWPVVHTDDFASHAEPMQWWPRMLRDVVGPLLRGEPARFHPYDWVARTFAATEIVVAPAPIVVIEGVGATRAAWRDRLALRVWIETARDVRLARGIARDGEQLREFWADWMRAEDGYVAEEDPQAYADLVVDGNPDAPSSPGEFVVISERR